MFAVVLFACWLGFSLFQIFLYKSSVVETLLLNCLVINVGLGNLIGFMGNSIFADEAAEYNGLPKGNPFQFEVAVANLALSVMGIASAWLRDNFWLATIVAYSIFMLGQLTAIPGK